MGEGVNGPIRGSTALVLAGGAGSRFGRPKAEVLLSGRPLWDHVLGRLQGVVGRVILVTKPSCPLSAAGVELAYDQEERQHPLVGLAAGLRAAGGGALVVGCDMPFLSRPLLRRLLSAAPGAQAVAPRWGGEVQPLCARYGARALRLIEAEGGPVGIEGAPGVGSLRSLLELLAVTVIEEEEVRALDPAGESFRDIDTPEDLARAEEWLRRSPTGAEGEG